MILPYHKQPALRSQRAMTMMEILVVIAVIGILAALLLPSLGKAKERAKSAMCANNLKQLATAMLMYSFEDKNKFIPIWGWEYDECLDGACWSSPSPAQISCGHKCGLIYPYLNSPSTFRCPSSPKGRDPSVAHWNPVWGFPPYWSYAVNGQPGLSCGGPGWRFNPMRVRPSASSVAMLLEQCWSDGPAYDNSVMLFNAVYSGGFNDDSLSGVHMGGGNRAFCDGHVEWMSRQAWIQKQSTAAGTIELVGGYVGSACP